MKIKRGRGNNFTIDRSKDRIVRLKKFTEQIDIFGQPTPGFNINGETKVKS